jgi:hypothetical protein
LRYDCQNRRVLFDKPDGLIFAENFRTTGQHNKCFKTTLERDMSKSGSAERQSDDKANRIKHRTCYTCRDKGHISKDCPKAQTSTHKLFNDDISHVKAKNNTSTTKVISSPNCSPYIIWVPKSLLTNHEGPNKAWVPKHT